MDVNQQVFVVDSLDPEVTAMLQAFYSRSDKSIAERLESLGTDVVKIKENLKKWYIGYGHSSIADCGDTTLFLENVSIIAAKAIQDDQLYNGQETSTRYFDFEHRAYVAPFGDTHMELSTVQSRLVSLYARMRPLVLERIQRDNPFFFNEASDDSSSMQLKKWENATNARSFDIVRGLLPAGMTTQLSWKGSLRRISERLHTLSQHPCTEINNLAHSVNQQLVEKYSSSFKPIVEQETLTYPFYDLDAPCTDQGLKIGEVKYAFSHYRELNDGQYYKTFLTERSRKTQVPNFFNFYGQFQFEFLLDYGSFRDIQRHRNSLTPLPMLGAYTINGASNIFHSWYLEQMGEYRDEVQAELIEIYQIIEDTLLECASQNLDMYEVHANMQYYYPMGTVVPVTATYGLAETIYVSELRTSATVHPTLRVVAHGMANAVREIFPDIKLYTDNSKDGFVLRRGAQDIFEQTGA